MVTVKCNFLDSLVQYLFMCILFSFSICLIFQRYFLYRQKKPNDNLKKITKKKKSKLAMILYLLGFVLILYMKLHDSCLKLQLDWRSSIPLCKNGLGKTLYHWSKENKKRKQFFFIGLIACFGKFCLSWCCSYF